MKSRRLSTDRRNRGDGCPSSGSRASKKQNGSSGSCVPDPLTTGPVHPRRTRFRWCCSLDEPSRSQFPLVSSYMQPFRSHFEADSRQSSDQPGTRKPDEPPIVVGYEAARRIRAEIKENEPSLVALTGWGDDKARWRTQDAGFDRHLVKRVDPDLLTRMIAELPEKSF